MSSVVITYHLHVIGQVVDGVVAIASFILQIGRE